MNRARSLDSALRRIALRRWCRNQQTKLVDLIQPDLPPTRAWYVVASIVTVLAFSAVAFVLAVVTR